MAGGKVSEWHGSGRLRFHCEPGPGERFLNIGCGMDVRVGPRWTNVDWHPVDRRVHKLDLLDFPWPFEDGEFDRVVAANVLEHMPPLMRCGRDVLWDVIEETWRVLKPDGELHVAVPRGGTPNAWNSLGHYRQWTVDSLCLLAQRDADGNVCPTKPHRADFRLERWAYNRVGGRLPDYARVGKSQLGLLSHAAARAPWWAQWLVSPRAELEALLVAVKS